MRLSQRSFIPGCVFIVAFAATQMARADQPVMHQARALTSQAYELLKNEATADKGGHRVIALKLLRDAIAELNAGIEYDRTHAGPEEGRRPR